MLTDLPNILTISRILVIPLIVAFAVFDTPLAATLSWGLYALACITDYFDGKLARSRHQMSDFGRMFDSIADKLLITACIMVLAGFDRLFYYSFWPAIVILCREILVSGLREYLAGVHESLPVTRLAKWKTAFQMVSLGFLLSGHNGAVFLHVGWIPASLIGSVLLWIAAILTLITGWGYLVKGLRHVSH